MSQVFDPESPIHSHYFQMNKEMMEAYMPLQGHDYDVPRKPIQNSNPRDRNQQEVILDGIIPHKREGSDVVIYCLPRTQASTSRRFIDLLNYFGSIGGFELVIQTLSNATPESISLPSVYNLSLIISQPFKLYHKQYLPTFGERFTDGVKGLILAMPLE